MTYLKMLKLTAAYISGFTITISCVGTWRSVKVAHERKFVKIDSSVGLDVAATLTVNPPTAYRMLKDFVALEPGTYVCVCVCVCERERERERERALLGVCVLLCA